MKLRDAGRYDEAIPLAESALAIVERLHGPAHADTAFFLNSTAELYCEAGLFAKAEPLYVRALAIREMALGPDDPETGASLNNLAALYETQGKYANAEPLYVRALAIAEKAFGPDHPDTALSLNNLAELYRVQGQYAKAEPLHMRALAIKEKALGPEHADVALSLNNLALIYLSQGQYSKAGPLFARALAITEKSLGPEHRYTASLLNNLAKLYTSQGQYARAEPVYERAIAILEKALGPGHPDVAFLLNNLAELHRIQGQFTKAELFYVRALAITEKAVGPEHSSTAIVLNNLAALYRSQGQYARAEPLYVQALAITEKALGPEHPATALMLNNLALLYLKTERYAKAGPLWVRAVAIQQKALGLEHPETVQSLFNLAGLYTATQDYTRAISAQARATEARERDLSRNLVSGSESEKLLYLQLSSYELDQTITLHAQRAPTDPMAERIAFEIILRRKGRALDAMTRQIEALRLRATPEDLKLLDELAADRSALSRFTLAGPGSDGIEAHRARIDALARQVEQLQGEIGRRSAQFAVESLPITLKAVSDRIPERAKLVEFAVYRPWDAKTDYSGPPRYVVYLVGRDGRIGFADLGEAATIDKLVAEFRNLLRSPGSDVDTELRPAARCLERAVMEPVRRLAGTSRQLLVSPDGALNLVPFAALVDEQDKYLVENWQIQYLTSGRDLLRLVDRPSGANSVILANPEFGTKPAGTERGVEVVGTGSAPATAVDLSGQLFTALPGTAQEAEALSGLLKATVLTGGKATEAALKGVSAPAILHIATHGYFLEQPETDVGPTDAQRGLSFEPIAGLSGLNPQGIFSNRSAVAEESIHATDPLLRSGLALAGANARLSGAGEDGLLTALEATGLNLWGTRIVVLSACDTGVGEVKTGDGVYGLRRALTLAGAETTVVSLWKVSDAGTRDLMIDFYKGLIGGESRVEALRTTQLKMIRDPKYRHPYCWAGFIETGAWGPID